MKRKLLCGILPAFLAGSVLGFPGDQGKIIIQKKDKQISIRSAFSPTEDIVIKVHSGINNQFSFLATILIDAGTPAEATADAKGKKFHHCPDDTPPISVPGTFMGGNHGCSNARQCKAAAHGLSSADIGSQYIDGSGNTFYIMKIINADHFWILSENTGKYPNWKFNQKLNASSFKNTATGKELKIESDAMCQLAPGTRIVGLEILADGAKPLPEQAAVTADFLLVKEIQEILAPDSLLAYVKQNPGREADFRAPAVETLLKRELIYRFGARGSCTVVQHTTAMRDISRVNDMVVMTATLNRTLYPQYEYYVPETKPFTVNGREVNFNRIQNMEGLSGSIYFEFPLHVPLRYIQFLGDASDRAFGLAIGVNPLYEMGSRELVAANSVRPMYIYKSGKTYPIQYSKAMKKGDCTKLMGYRCYFAPGNTPELTDMYSFHDGTTPFLFIDTHKKLDNHAVSLFPEFHGRELELVEKSPGIEWKQKGNQLLISTSDAPEFLFLRVK